MQLTTLTLRNFRNHRDTKLEFSSGINVLLGDNGQGKTNIIEGISYICLTKSFYASGDAVVLQLGKGSFVVEGRITSGNGIENFIRISYDKSLGRKVYLLNRKNIQPLTSVIGKFPVVICSPEQAVITFGNLADRRKFVDLVISQSNNNYLSTLIEYRKILKNRNKILQDAKLYGKINLDVLIPWNEQLVKKGSQLISCRKDFTIEFEKFISMAYQKLIDGIEEPSIKYRSNVPLNSDMELEDIEELFKEKLNEKYSKEQSIGATLVGPHRDEFILSINGMEIRKYASKGQHKTFLVALKLSEFFYLKERCGETPILLLDDIFSELDKRRAGKLFSFVSTLSQAFITSTTPEIFSQFLSFGGVNRIFIIHGGQVVEQNKVSCYEVR